MYQPLVSVCRWNVLKNMSDTVGIGRSFQIDQHFSRWNPKLAQVLCAVGIVFHENWVHIFAVRGKQVVSPGGTKRDVATYGGRRNRSRRVEHMFRFPTRTSESPSPQTRPRSPRAAHGDGRRDASAIRENCRHAFDARRVVVGPSHAAQFATSHRSTDACTCV